MDTCYPEIRDHSPCDRESDTSTVESWTIDELRQCAELDSVRSAWTAVDDWRA